jgi:hypothetical protein
MTQPYNRVTMAVYDVMGRLAQCGRWTWSACFVCLVARLVLDAVQMPLLATIMDGLGVLCGGVGIGVYLAWYSLMRTIEGVLRAPEEPRSNVEDPA